MTKDQHEAWLRKMGVHPEQLKAKKKGGRNLRNIFSQPVSKISNPDLSNLGTTGLKKEENVYTGRNLVGIAVMHKSCLQPVFTKQAAKDSANMRRN